MGTVDARLADVEGDDFGVSFAVVKTRPERVGFAIGDARIGGQVEVAPTASGDPSGLVGSADPLHRPFWYLPCRALPPS